MQALVKAGNNDPARLDVIAGQSVVVISMAICRLFRRTIRGPYSLLNPERLFVTRPDAIFNGDCSPDVTQRFEAGFSKAQYGSDWHRAMSRRFVRGTPFR